MNFRIKKIKKVQNLFYFYFSCKIDDKSYIAAYSLPRKKLYLLVLVFYVCSDSVR